MSSTHRISASVFPKRAAPRRLNAYKCVQSHSVCSHRHPVFHYWADSSPFIYYVCTDIDKRVYALNPSISTGCILTRSYSRLPFVTYYGRRLPSGTPTGGGKVCLRTEFCVYPDKMVLVFVRGASEAQRRSSALRRDPPILVYIRRL